MNQLGAWQLIIMAREGDRNAIEQLFYMTYRKAYIIALAVTGKKDTAADITVECFSELFHKLNTINETDQFLYELITLVLNRSQKAVSAPVEALSADEFSFDGDLFEQIGRIYDFDTLPDVETNGAADKIIGAFDSLPLNQRLCDCLFYFVGFPNDVIAEITETSEECVKGVILKTTLDVLPTMEDIQREEPALDHITPVSLIPWALKLTNKYAPNDNETALIEKKLSGLLVSDSVIDTHLSGAEEKEAEPDEPLELNGISPLSNKDPVSSSTFFKVIVALLTVLIVAGVFFALREIREYHRRRAELDSLTQRTTLAFSDIPIPPTQVIYYTTEPTTAETEPETTETTTEATTEEPTTTTTTTTTTTKKETTTKPEKTTEPEDFGGLLFADSGSGITITGFDNRSTSVVIPEAIRGKPVRAIAANAFYNSPISSITLPGTLVSIGSAAFYNCTSLKSVTVPAGVTTIPENCFRDCSGLTFVSLPSTVTLIDDTSFYKCTSLQRINLPSGLRLINEWAFAYCYALTNLAVPDSVTSIGPQAFYNCTSLATCQVSQNSKMTSLGENAFAGCTKLTQFNIAPSVTSIPKACFNGCSSLKSITIPNKVVTIDSNAFTGCSAMTTVNIGTGLRRIESAAFAGCTSVKTVTFKPGMQAIGADAFNGCKQLSSVYIPSSVNEIGSRAFANCPALTISCPAGSAAETYADNNEIAHLNR
ncbi:MAG: leucine-rich repeat protein [Clostridiales bacterium]|nr:leucine-rich repeat protein [Clostridiales bacterium]